MLELVVWRNIFHLMLSPPPTLLLFASNFMNNSPTSLAAWGAPALSWWAQGMLAGIENSWCLCVCVGWSQNTCPSGLCHILLTLDFGHTRSAQVGPCYACCNASLFSVLFSKPWEFYVTSMAAGSVPMESHNLQSMNGQYGGWFYKESTPRGYRRV